MTEHALQEKHRLDYQPPLYLIDHIALDVQLDDHQTRVRAVSQVRRSGEHAQSLVLDGEAMRLVAVAVDGQPWSQYELEPHQLVLHGLPQAFELCIETELDPEANTALTGLYKSGSAFCTQCEAEGFRRITYYLDRPDVLARFETRITADREAYPHLLSNGNPVGQGALTDGRHWVSWVDPFPKPCYLFALVAGNFDVLRDEFVTFSGRKVALELFVDKGNLDRAEHAMASLKKAMRWDEERFGLEYDLDIYMIVAVDFFNMGAMENKGLNVFNSKFVLANPQTATDTDYFDIERVIAHEYFHNWTGNRITCRDWFQLSLKEGLTVFRDQEFSSDIGSRAINRIRNVRIIRGPQFAEDAGPMSHPIRPDVVVEMNNFYTLTVYEKGSEVIRMLHTLLGEADFQAGMRLYVSRHDGQAVTCDDFVSAMEDASGRDLSQFRRWYSQSGTPRLTVRDHYDAERQRYRLMVSQQTPPTADQAEKLPLHIPLSLALYGASGHLLVNQGVPLDLVLEVTEAEQEFCLEGVSEAPIVSLLQEFSAPIKLDYPYTDTQLAFLMAHARNAFARWDASQMLLNKHVLANVARFQAGEALHMPESLLQALREVLLDERLDKALAAEILRLPSEVSLAELFDAVDVDAIHAVRNFVQQEIARGLQKECLAVYHANQLTGYRITQQDMAARDLASVCLGYLALADASQGDALVQAQYERADNMTDLLAAMQAAKAAQLACLPALLADFEARWHKDGLVMDNWFRLQASSPAADCLSRVRQLLDHPAFSLNNPNRVRALIGTFSAANPVHFHAQDGSGYRFLGEILRQLNGINPQVAARMVTPLIQFQRLDPARQALMRAELQRLADLPGLARDLEEKVVRALAS